MTITTDIGYATVHDIFVRGESLSTSIIPTADFAEIWSAVLAQEASTLAAKRAIRDTAVTARTASAASAASV